MRLRVLMLSVVGTTASAAFGQTTAVPRGPSDRDDRAQAERRSEAPPSQQQASPQRPRPTGVSQADAAALLREHGNSLLKASLAARPDASQAQLKDVSYTAVPVPEPKVIRKHDLVTIIVREESQYSSEGSTESTRESSLDAAITDFVKLRLANLEVEGGGIGPVPPRVAANANREFTGEGATERSDRFTARITAEVLDVKPNGTLVLQARKRIKTDEEEQIFILSGTCRAEDITADNTILSTALHDQELTKTHKGTVRNATRRGWGSKLLDVISPF
jgi:flagellar L-ring protein precursor FlgH